MKRIFSGIRPTGTIHLGNYLGAIKQWVRDFDPAAQNLFCIVDMHALTTVDESENISHNAKLMAATYLACGLDPKHCTIFVQSHVKEHGELAWILSCITPLGWLNRMTQFKEKAGKMQENANLGLYAYPVLMAADILLYNTTHVPVGEDQKQHVELARDIAGAFNHRFGECFTLPEPIIQGSATRVMSLRDGTSKMSKSDASDYSRIHLSDDAEIITKKIKKAKTDGDVIASTMQEMEARPEAKNLINMLSALTGLSADQLCKDFTHQNFSVLKTALIDALHTEILPIGQKIQEYMKDSGALDTILQKGAQQAHSLAAKNLQKIKKHVGL